MLTSRQLVEVSSVDRGGKLIGGEQVIFASRYFVPTLRIRNEDILRTCFESYTVASLVAGTLTTEIILFAAVNDWT